MKILSKLVLLIRRLDSLLALDERVSRLEYEEKFNEYSHKRMYKYHDAEALSRHLAIQKVEKRLSKTDSNLRQRIHKLERKFHGISQLPVLRQAS